MKNYLILLVVVLVGFQAKAQKSLVNIDATRYYALVSKGYYWKGRPEAKEIYEGRIPEGVDEIYQFQELYFIEYEEHTEADNNFVVAPVGVRLYRKASQWYDSYCGNKVKSFIPVNTQVQRVIDTLYVDRINNTVSYDTVYKYIYMERQEEQPQPYQTVVCCNSCAGNYQYSQQMTMPVMMPFPVLIPISIGGNGGGNTYVDNSSYYTDNSINNSYNNRQPKPEPEPGGPAPVPGHDDGGPASVPGHDDKMGGGPSGNGGHDDQKSTLNPGYTQGRTLSSRGSYTQGSRSSSSRGYTQGNRTSSSRGNYSSGRTLSSRGSYGSGRSHR